MNAHHPQHRRTPSTGLTTDVVINAAAAHVAAGLLSSSAVGSAGQWSSDPLAVPTDLDAIDVADLIDVDALRSIGADGTRSPFVHPEAAKAKAEEEDEEEGDDDAEDDDDEEDDEDDEEDDEEDDDDEEEEDEFDDDDDEEDDDDDEDEDEFEAEDE